MAGSGIDWTGSRIANATRTWQANEDVAVTGWTKEDDFIVGVMNEATGHGGASGSIELYWRNATDGGSFAALGNTGELTYNGTTNLVNGNAVASGEEGCTPTDANTLIDGVEREGANGVSTTYAQNEYSEHHWAVDASGGLDNKTYEFQVYDATAGATIASTGAVSTLLATLTTFAAATETILDYERGVGRGVSRGVGRGVM